MFFNHKIFALAVKAYWTWTILMLGSWVHSHMFSAKIDSFALNMWLCTLSDRFFSTSHHTTHLAKGLISLCNCKPYIHIFSHKSQEFLLLQSWSEFDQTCTQLSPNGSWHMLCCFIYLFITLPFNWSVQISALLWTWSARYFFLLKGRSSSTMPNLCS